MTNCILLNVHVCLLMNTDSYNNWNILLTNETHNASTLRSPCNISLLLLPKPKWFWMQTKISLSVTVSTWFRGKISTASKCTLKHTMLTCLTNTILWALYFFSKKESSRNAILYCGLDWIYWILTIKKLKLKFQIV